MPVKKVLGKYDEEIFGEKKNSFVIGDKDQEEARKFKQMMVSSFFLIGLIFRLLDYEKS
jgi:hypothetical protein